VTAATRVVLVGESNPHSTDPRYALYDEPPGASGDRLRRLILQVPRRVYFGETFARHNLCRGGWTVRKGREAAAALRQLYAGDPVTFVLLGRKVADAWSLETPVLPWRRTGSALCLPHPSGRNLAWNVPGAFERARTLLREAIPDVPWGSEVAP
jgi:hypothetical protein